MFDLQACIRFDENEAVPIQVYQKLESAEIGEAYMAGNFQRRVADPPAKFVTKRRRGGNLDDFLMTPLNTAVPFAQMDDVTRLIARDLHLDMPRARNQTFHVQIAVAECGGGFRLAAPIRFVQPILA